MNDAFRALTTGVRFKEKRRVPAKELPVASTSKGLAAELDLLGNSGGATTDSKREHDRDDGRDSFNDEDYAALMRKHKIKYTAGTDDDNHDDADSSLLKPVGSFKDYEKRYGPLPQVLSNNWKQSMRTPTAVQMAVWPLLSERKDVLCCAPTGSGKTLSFVVPLLALHEPATTAIRTKDQVCSPRVVVLEPTRELASQVAREVERTAQGGQWVIQGPPTQEHTARRGKRKGKAKETDERDEEREESERWPACDWLVTTPLRLIFAIKAGKVDVSQTEHLILDEADQLFELNFVKQTDEIVAACTNPDLRKGMFSATLPSAIEELARSIMSPSHVVRAIIGHKDSATDTIEQSLVFAGSEDHKLLTLRSMIAEGAFKPPVLIFVQSIVRAKELATALAFEGINAAAIHADLTPSERDALVRSFARGETWSLIATDVMARGLDFERMAIEMVINYDLPQSAHAYIHRIGRTGRAGKRGRAVTLFTKRDAKYVRTIVNVMRASGQPVPEWMLTHLPKVSKRDKRQVKLNPLKRKDVSKTTGAGQVDKRDRRVKKRKRVMGGEDLKGDRGKRRKDLLQDDDSASDS